jgi:CHASE1-domain containing sensor protein
LSERVLGQLRTRIDAANQAIYGARAHLLTSDQVTRDSWAAYSAAALPAVGEGIVGLGYASASGETTSRNSKRECSAKAHPHIGSRERARANGCTAVTRIEPGEKNVGVLGLDIIPQLRRLAADEAMRTGTAVLSRRIRIIEGRKEVPGFLLLVPVYRQGQDVQRPRPAQRGACRVGRMPRFGSTR